MVADLSDRFDVVLEALEQEPGCVTNRTSYDKLDLGELGGIETGVRQLIRARPLETESYDLPDERSITIPTAAETLRVKAFLIIKRNQARDYLDVAALADRFGVAHSAAALSRIDSYYADQAPDDGTVAAQLARQLADPRPKDSRTTGRLADYKGLHGRWTDWRQVRAIMHPARRPHDHRTPTLIPARSTARLRGTAGPITEPVEGPTRSLSLSKGRVSLNSWRITARRTGRGCCRR